MADYIENDILKIIEQAPNDNKYTDVVTIIDDITTDNTNINGEIDVNNFSDLGFFIEVANTGSSDFVLNVYTRTEVSGSNYYKEEFDLGILSSDTLRNIYINVDVATAQYIYFDLQCTIGKGADITIKTNKKYI